MFSSIFDPHAQHLNPIRLNDQAGIANLWHIFKLLTHSKTNKYSKVKNKINQSMKRRGYMVSKTWFLDVKDTNEKCSYHYGKFLIDLIYSDVGIPDEENNTISYI